MVILYIYPVNTSTLCGGLKEGKNGSKIFYTYSFSKVKHPKVITGSLLPFRIYLIPPGSFTLCLFPLFLYEDLSEYTITKLNQISINP